jgi:hypothetical protein
MAEILLGAFFVDRVLEETDEDTPVIGKYRGLLRPVVKAVIGMGRRQKKRSHPEDG